MKKTGLAFKFIAFFSIIEIILFLLIGNFIIRRESHLLKEALKSKGISMARNLAANSKEAISYTNIDHLLLVTFAKDIKKEKDVEYVIIHNINGKIIGHNDINEIEKNPSDLISKNALQSNNIIVQEYFKGKITIIDISCPIMISGKKIGIVRIGFNDKVIKEAIFKTTIEILYLTLFVLTIGIFGISLLVHLFLKPVKDLHAGVIAISKGDYNHRVKVSGRDEITELSIAFNQMAESIAEKETIKKALRLYVTQEVMDEILKNPENISLHGVRKYVTVFFADIRDFSSMVEKLEPEKVVQVLNDTLSLITEIIFKYGGTLDKFIGDCVMAVFGAPLSHKNDAVRAVLSALEIQMKINIKEKNENQTLHPVRVGIGISSGEVIAGNMGSTERMDYTVIGDAVNVASRLVSIAKGGQIIICSHTYEQVKDIIDVNKIPHLKIKGKEKFIDAYEVVSVKNVKKVN